MDALSNIIIDNIVAWSFGAYKYRIAGCLPLERSEKKSLSSHFISKIEMQIKKRALLEVLGDRYDSSGNIKKYHIDARRLVPIYSDHFLRYLSTWEQIIRGLYIDGYLGHSKLGEIELRRLDLFKTGPPANRPHSLFGLCNILVCLELRFFNKEELCFELNRPNDLKIIKERKIKKAQRRICTSNIYRLLRERFSQYYYLTLLMEEPNVTNLSPWIYY
ncbi:MAG: hypothetical protein FVQ81_02790 [Candidatus Glassbacteria bacterium]|nr:hypothetical protein [Candidatus Glassbacteria bacterium]